MTETDTQPTLQRPDLGIESVKSAASWHVKGEDYPWITQAMVEVPTVLVRLQGLEVPFRYGSLVSANHSVEKIADDVPLKHSINGEQGMFKALPNLLTQQNTPTLESIQIPNSKTTILKTTKQGPDVARFFFTVGKDENGLPVVLKIGIAPHKKQEELINVLRKVHNAGRKKNRA
jgi:hypothetical protein